MEVTVDLWVIVSPHHRPYGSLLRQGYGGQAADWSKSPQRPRRSPKGVDGPGKNTVLSLATTAFTSLGEPSDFAVWSQLIASRRPSMQFLFISSRVSHSLPSNPTSRLRTWLLVIVLFILLLVLTIVDFNHIYTVPMLGTPKPQLSTPFALQASLFELCPASRASFAIVLHVG